MKQAMLERGDKSVFVRSDAAITMQEFMRVIDKLKEGGVEKVAISTRPVER
jgi:biopolymer transport protein ExbD